MSEELDRRAALAMGSAFDKKVRWFFDTWEDDEIVTKETIKWHPSADRNDLAELLAETNRRGLGEEVIARSRYSYPLEFLLADPAVICLAAVEVLEANNG